MDAPTPHSPLDKRQRGKDSSAAVRKEEGNLMSDPDNPSGYPDDGYDAIDDELELEERQWAMFAHLAGLAGFVFPFGNLIGPLIVWQVKKDQMPFVDEQGKEALNFQITVCLALLVSLVLMLVLIGFLLMPIVAVGALVFTVIAAIKANDGEHYRYPFALRLIS